ncbi:MAG TPA: amidohydrolase family protein [Acidimicrobiales bacterium]|nr:amidohydrolase family protein [Acidimicrobiales bacterium]
MATIDSDAHVVECEETWSFIDGEDKAFTPALVEVPGGGRSGGSFWVIDGRLIRTGPVSETDAIKAVREMTDVPARLKQMDEIGTDLQVIYPTVFLRPLTNRPEVERALCRSYNRWLAGRCAEGEGRLSWAVIPPTMDIEAAIEEVRFGAANGAGVVFWRGFEGQSGRLPSDEYFAPLFEEIDRLGLAVGIHAANGTFALHDIFEGDSGIWRFKVPGIVAFSTILASGLPARYPHIRWGFVELQAQWVPYVVADYVRRQSRRGEVIDPASVMRDHHLYVACQTDDDLEYIIRYAGPDNLVAGTDFGHADTSSELLALQRLREAAAVEAPLIDRILDDNARALYGLAPAGR